MSTSTANVLFCDIVSSTRHRVDLGEVDADRFFHQTEQRFREVVQQGHGDVVKGGGDGVMATFPSASDAVSTAVELHRVIHAIDDRVSLRVGIAAGDVSWEGDDCYGMPVVVAARLQAAGERGDILVSSVVRALAGTRAGVEYVPVGALELRGVPDPVEAYSVPWDLPAEPSVTRPFPPILTRSGTFPFTGRDAEMAQLLELWDRAERGGSCAAILGGEAGAGKTRLATEVAMRCHDDGATVVAGLCDSELSVPYQPWLMAIDQLVGQLPEATLTDLPSHLAHLLALSPQLGERLTGLTQPAPVDPETQRQHIFEAIVTVIEAAASQASVLIVIDDLHWAGSRTLDLLRYLVVNRPVPRCLVVATHRDTSDEIDDELAATLAALRRRDGVRHVRVGGMEAHAVRELLDDGRDGEQPMARARSIVERTGGNAFLVMELLREPTGDDGVVPDGVADVVRFRLQHLSPPARAMADVIAVAGRADLRILADLAVRREVDLGPTLLELTTCGLLREVTGPVPEYQYTHALLRDAVRDQLSAFESVELNQLVARSIEEVHAADRRPYLAALARHYLAAAGVAGWEKAAYYGRRAAAQAHRTASYDEAIGLIEATLPITPSGTAQRVELLIDAAKLLERCGRSAEAVSLTEQACEIASELDHPVLEASACVELERSAHLANADLGHSLPFLRRLLRRPDRLPESARIRCAASLGRASWLVGQPGAHDLTASALADARRLADEHTVAHALEMACVIEQDPRVALELAIELEHATEITGEVFQSMWAMTRQTDALITLGRLDEASSVRQRLSDAADRYRYTSYRYLAFAFTHTLALAAADFEVAEAATEAANTAEQEEFAGLDVSGAYGLQMFMIRRAQGQLDEMRPMLQVLSRHGRAPGIWLPGLVVAYLELDMRADAEQHFDRLVTDEWSSMTRDTLWPLALTFLADACVALERTDVAPLLLGELRAHAGITIRAGYTTNGGPADRFIAALAELHGDHETADHHAGAAIGLAERSGSPLWIAMSIATRAWILARRGDVAAAAPDHARALDLAHRHGLGCVPTELPSARTRGPAPRDARPYELSDREVDVLRELAAGRTNREIAQRLFISPNTAANHVRAILRKTGCTNRTEAAALAYRHDLAGSDELDA